jgi:hypothetical protein
MSKLASATTIPVMNKAMQENSRISLRIERTAGPSPCTSLNLKRIAVGPLFDWGPGKIAARRD